MEEQKKPKERREKKIQEIDSKNLGLKIYAGVANKFSEVVTYDEILDGICKGRFKLTFTDKRSEVEIMALIERKVKINDEDLKVVPDDVYRKIQSLLLVRRITTDPTTVTHSHTPLFHSRQSFEVTFHPHIQTYILLVLVIYLAP